MALLSHRLNTLRSYYTSENHIWDIGCDHGDLGLSFIDTEGVECIHLVDPSEAVINKLKDKLDSYITKNALIKISKTYGENLNIKTKNNMIYIAGMGGKEIAKILSNIQTQVTPYDKIIISPHRYVFELREELASSPWKLFNEKIIFENAQYYQVLAISLSGEIPVHQFGIDIWKGELGVKYLNHVISYLQSHQDLFSRKLLQYLKSQQI